MPNYINLTPHTINLNDGTVIEASTDYAPIRIIDNIGDIDENGICHVSVGEIQNLPPVIEDTYYIVSRVVAQQIAHPNFVAPATTHPEAVRNEHGHIVSVPCFFSFV